MKLEQEYPNYISAIRRVHQARNLVRGSSVSSKIIHQIPLASINNGFDFYELEKAANGNVCLQVVTMSGFRTLLSTYSSAISYDLSIEQWEDVITDVAMKHFMKEEYIALKNGYIKKGSGCLGMALVLISVAAFTFKMIIN
jgi:hypothetical protein